MAELHGSGLLRYQLSQAYWFILCPVDRPKFMVFEPFIPIVQLRPSGLLCYYEHSKGHKKKVFNSLNPPPVVTYTGYMTSKAARKVKRAIQILLAISEWKTAHHLKTGRSYKWKINFVTLTLSATQGNRSDEDLIKYVFQPFLRILRNKYGWTTYVWRVERQKNGNLHWHITGNRWINWRFLRTDWNRCQAKLGFIDQFEKKHGHRDPNSTDVHSVNHIRNLAGYLAKYMAKTEKVSQNISGKLWDCSLNIKRAKFPTLICEGLIDEAVNHSVKTLHDKILEMDFSTLIVQSNFLKGRAWSDVMKTTYRAWLESVKN